MLINISLLRQTSASVLILVLMCNGYKQKKTPKFYTPGSRPLVLTPLTFSGDESEGRELSEQVVRTAWGSVRHPDLIAHDLKSSKRFFFVGSTLSFCVGDFRNSVLTTL